MSAGHTGKYEVDVSAISAQEAIDIAAEGLPRGAELVSGNATDISATHGPESWHVKLTFRGGKRASSDFAG